MITYAAGNSATDIVKDLLAHRAAPDTKNRLGRTALMQAAFYGNANAIVILLAAGANPKLKDSRGQTAQDLARSNRRSGWTSVSTYDGIEALLKRAAQ